MMRVQGGRIPAAMAYAIAVSSEMEAQRLGLPGLCFGHFVRELVQREWLHGQGVADEHWQRIVHPVDGLRYFEFDQVMRSLRAVVGRLQGLAVLDVSSPWCLPFWLAIREGAKVTMLNPDQQDLERSMAYAGRAGVADTMRFVHAMVDDVVEVERERFDIVTSVSVIEHAEDDKGLISAMARCLRPGGWLVATVPVSGAYKEEYRPAPAYPTQRKRNERGWYFFQRFYGRQELQELLEASGCEEQCREYCAERVPGWFDEYIRAWQAFGQLWVLNDAALFARNMRITGREHPADRFGNCCIVLRKT